MGGRVHNLIIEQDKVDGRDRYKFKYKDNSDGVVRSYSSAVVGKTKIIDKFDRWSRKGKVRTNKAGIFLAGRGWGRNLRLIILKS